MALSSVLDSTSANNNAEGKTAHTLPNGREVRVPPHNLSMEQAVLAALMTVSESWESISELLNENDFYAVRHRLIFRAISHLASTNMPYDAVLVDDWLSKSRI